jgi:CheY-like chemotaxis protein/DNA-directed RNA polymerase specialized sigma24 family protein
VNHAPARPGASGLARCLSEEDILVLLRPGYGQTLAELYERYRRIAGGLARCILQEPAVAEAAVEATFLSTLQSDRCFTDPGHAGAEIVALVHQESVARARHAVARSDLAPRERQWPPANGGAWTELERGLVPAALEQLPGPERHILVLAYYAGLTATEPAGSAEPITGTIQFGLRRLAAALASSRAGRAGDGEAADGRSRGVILVCDGNPVHRDLIRASLQRSAYDLFELGDIHLLVGSNAAVAPDLIILEPGAVAGDGVGELRALRAGPDGAHVPVLVLTTAVSRRREQAALAAGADIFLPKPFSPRHLAATVVELLARTRVVTETRAAL